MPVADPAAPTEPKASPRFQRAPLVITAAAALASVSLLATALALGWLGPDIGRGGGFCEAARDALVRQPANTWSNVGFVIAGLAASWHVSRRGSGTMSAPLGTAYAVVVVLLGPGSAAMHASQSELGGHLDLYSMYLLASFVLAYAAARLLRLATTGFVGLFVAALGLCTVAEFTSADVPVVMTLGNAVFAVMLLAGLAMEVVLRTRGGVRLDVRWGFASVAALLVAFAIWNTGKDGGPLCDPHSLLQPHAVWHLLDAGAAWLLFRYYASRRP
ncbi:MULTISPECIES: ceramidase domain-containing protein [unclassified Knoellia]|uniref:ceramidase domain-containing protein n=1 Tax=Knoellia altitudinis TaxID=3404795 RepID=UPI003621E82A